MMKAYLRHLWLVMGQYIFWIMVTSLISGKRNPEEVKEEEEAEFTKCYTDWKGKENIHNTFKHIPRFYYKVS